MSCFENDLPFLMPVSRTDQFHNSDLFPAMQETASSYSSFCSEQYPAEYEAYMLEATAASQVAKQKLTLEKRFGKAREDLEQSLVSVLHATAAKPKATSDPATAFQEYIDWETDPRARNPKGPKSPVTDVALTRAVFERAIAHLARTSVRDSAQTEEQVQAYKEAEASIWNRYLRWTDNPLERNMVHQRAVRACPQVARVWTNLLRETVRISTRINADRKGNLPARGFRRCLHPRDGYRTLAYFFCPGRGFRMQGSPPSEREPRGRSVASSVRETHLTPDPVIATVKEGLEVIHTTGQSTWTSLKYA